MKNKINTASEKICLSPQSAQRDVNINKPGLTALQKKGLRVSQFPQAAEPEGVKQQLYPDQRSRLAQTSPASTDYLLILITFGFPL